MERKELLRMIIQYAQQHSEAGDTIEGITNWWVAQELLQVTRENVSEVVKFLCDKGILIEKRYSQRDSFYFVNKEKLFDLNQLLNEYT